MNAATSRRTGRGREPGARIPRRGDPAGYALVVGAYVLFSVTPVLVAAVALRTSFVLVVRYAIAAGVPLLVFGCRRPLAALWQTAGHGLAFSAPDLVTVVLIGVVFTALAFAMWVEGVARVRVQHSAILGPTNAVGSPVFAFLLLGQGLSPGVLVGGVLILTAGALVVLRGAGEPELEPPL